MSRMDPGAGRPDYANEMGVTVSCDLNYRSKLWKWGTQPRDVMPGLVKSCDVAIGNEEDAGKSLGIHAPDTDVTSGVKRGSIVTVEVTAIEDGGIDFRAARLINAGGAAGQDNTLGIQGLDLFAGDRGRFDLAVHPALPHASGNKLIELGTEINDQDHVYL